MYKLSDELTRDLANEFCDMLQDGELMEHAEDHIRQVIINNYDGEIWEIADDEEVDFDEVVCDVLDEIVALGNDYYDNAENE